MIQHLQLQFGDLANPGLSGVSLQSSTLLKQSRELKLTEILNAKIAADSKEHSATTDYCHDWLSCYAAGDSTPFNPDFFATQNNATDFCRKVWAVIEQIPFGETRSYKDIACAIGHPLAARAVGTATGRNPCLIFRPCHRVIAANGGLGGFAFDLEIKKALLAHESLNLKCYG